MLAFRSRIVGILVMMVCPASIVQAQITLGVAGDSLSDEYMEESYNYALNWVEQLSAYGVADVGQTADAVWPLDGAGEALFRLAPICRGCGMQELTPHPAGFDRIGRI